MQILKGIKEVLALVGLTDDQTVRKIAGIRVHRVVARSIVVVVLVLWLMAIILIINQMQVKDFDEILRPLNFGFFSGCELISYLCLCRKTKQIDHLFDYMENVVNNRKLARNVNVFYVRYRVVSLVKYFPTTTWKLTTILYIQRVKISLQRVVQQKIGFFSGCKEDEEVVLIYETLHRTIENYLKTGMFAMKFAILLAYVTPTVIATLLYIFGWLSFDVYQLPLDLSWVLATGASTIIGIFPFSINVFFSISPDIFVVFYLKTKLLDLFSPIYSI